LTPLNFRGNRDVSFFDQAGATPQTRIKTGKYTPKTTALENMFTRNSIDMNNNFLGFPISNFTNITNVVSQIGKPGNCAANNLCIKSITGKNRMAQEKNMFLPKRRGTKHRKHIETILKSSTKHLGEKKNMQYLCQKTLCICICILD
jgi:hypothetical protein